METQSLKKKKKITLIFLSRGIYKPRKDRAYTTRMDARGLVRDYVNGMRLKNTQQMFTSTQYFRILDNE